MWVRTRSCGHRAQMKADVQKENPRPPPPSPWRIHNEQSERAWEALSLFITSRAAPTAYLRPAPWRGSPRASWPRTGPRGTSLGSTGWRSRSPPRRSCRRHRGMWGGGGRQWHKNMTWLHLKKWQEKRKFELLIKNCHLNGRQPAHKLTFQKVW